jgi:hypothetical protein
MKLTKKVAPSPSLRLALRLAYLFAASPLLATSCGGQEERDCRSVCARTRECVSADYDTAACRQRCGKKVDERDFVAQLEHCATCIESRTCSEATKNCLVPCLGIVP